MRQDRRDISDICQGPQKAELGALFYWANVWGCCGNSDQPHAPIPSTAYDQAGRIASLNGDGRTLTFAYDKAGRLTSKLHDTGGGGGNGIGYAYDDNSNVTEITYPDGWTVTHTYDALNRLDRILENGTRELADYTYDVQSRRTAVAYGNGAQTDYGFTARGDLTDLDLNFAVQQASFTHSYDGVGQLTGRTLSDTGFAPKANQNGTTNYTANTLNQYASVDGAAHTYDPNGNLTTTPIGTFAYDAENVLRSGTVNGQAFSYTTWPDGNRASKTVSGLDTLFYLTGNQVIADYDGSGTLLRRYVRGPGVDEAFLMIDYTGATPVETWAHQDRLGSTIAVSDDTGTVQEKITYASFGETDAQTGFPFKFTGQRFDPETELYHYKARTYSPTLGRFLQTDPIGYADQMNLYGYVQNDPTGEIGVFGAVVGAGLDFAVQVGGNLASGQSLGASISNVNYYSVAASAALGAVGQVGGATVARSFIGGASNKLKGQVGEAFARVGIAARGEKLIAAQRAAGRVQQLGTVTGRAAKAVPDFVVQTRKGAIKVVEAKFNKAGLTGAQRALRNQLGDAFTIARTGLDDVARAGGIAGGILGGSIGAAIPNSAFGADTNNVGTVSYQVVSPGTFRF